MQVPARLKLPRHAYAISSLLWTCTAAAEAKERAAVVEDCEKRIHVMQRECTQRVKAAVRKAEHRSALMLLWFLSGVSRLALSTSRH